MPPFALKFTTEDETMRGVASAYWELDALGKFSSSIEVIAGSYQKTAIEIQRITGLASEACSLEIFCSHCAAPYIFRNRADFQSRASKARSHKCTLCTANLAREAKDSALKKEKAERGLIEKSYAVSLYAPALVEEMTLTQRVYALAIIRAGASEDFSHIRSIEKLGAALTPGSRSDGAILDCLWESRIIIPHPASPLASFAFPEGQPPEFYLSRVYWAWPAKAEHPTMRESYIELEARLDEDAGGDEQADERLELAHRVALWECLDYLGYSLGQHKLPFTPGDKTRAVLSQVLKCFSVGQTFGFIWRAAKDAAAFQVQKSVPRQQAANTVVATIQKNSDRALSENWSPNHYRRDRGCPQSILSQIVFSKILRVGERYLEMCLSEFVH